MAAMTKPMWLIDEYAMRDFKSVCCKHVRFASVAPHMARMINGRNTSVFTIGRVCIIRIIPYPPSFSKMAASTIDPATGASTCAFGSHRWSP